MVIIVAVVIVVVSRILDVRSCSRFQIILLFRRRLSLHDSLTMPAIKAATKAMKPATKAMKAAKATKAATKAMKPAMRAAREKADDRGRTRADRAEEERVRESRAVEKKDYRKRLKKKEEEEGGKVRGLEAKVQQLQKKVRKEEEEESEWKMDFAEEGTAEEWRRKGREMVKEALAEKEDEGSETRKRVRENMVEWVRGVKEGAKKRMQDVMEGTESEQEEEVK